MADQKIPTPPLDSLPLATNRELGSIGTVSSLAIGCWRLVGSDDTNTRVINTAVDAGITLIDNADVYGLDWGGTHFGACEEALGRIFLSQPSLRDRVIVATKAGIVPGIPYNSSADYLISACEASLARMAIDHIDLFQIHRPDLFTHPEEVASACESLRSRGLVREIGVSNYTSSQTLALNAFLSDGLVSTQPEFSALHLDPLRDGTFDFCMEAGITPMAWSPLAGGSLATGDGVSPALIAQLDSIAQREGVTRAAVAVAFVLAHPSAPIAIIGTQSPEHVLELCASTTISLTRADVYAIIEASDGHPLP